MFIIRAAPFPLSQITMQRTNRLPCITLLPIIFCLTILNKSLLTPPQTTFIRVSGFSHIPTTALPDLPQTQVDTLYKIRMPPLSRLLHRLITTTNQTGLLAFPCGQHTTITHPLLQLLNHTNRITNFKYVCQDPDSRSLANAHAELYTLLPSFVAKFRRAKFSKLPLTADVLLMPYVQTDNLRTLLLTAAGVGIRFVVLRSSPMPGLPCVGREDKIQTFDNVHSHLPFPFAHALVAVSHAYGFGQHFVLVYDLSFLPTVKTVTDLTRIQVETDLMRDKIRN